MKIEIKFNESINEYHVDQDARAQAAEARAEADELRRELDEVRHREGLQVVSPNPSSSSVLLLMQVLNEALEP